MDVEGYFTRRGQWLGWREFLGLPEDEGMRLYGATTGNAELIPFETARALLAPLKIKNMREYRKKAKAGELPAGLALRPEILFLRHDVGAPWLSWPHYLSSQRQKNDFGQGGTPPS